MKKNRLRFSILIAMCAPSALLAQTPTSATKPGSGPFLYYCRETNSYFPSVDHCREGWIAVPPPPAPLRAEVMDHPVATEATVQSQRNSVDLELMGKALVYSFNYDRAISQHITLGAGGAYWRSNNWWHDYHAGVTVVPVYANYYFSQKPYRGFLSLGADWISVTQAGFNNNTFSNNGFAAVIGGGYEMHDISGFLLRLGGFLIVGRSVTISPSASLGFAF